MGSGRARRRNRRRSFFSTRRGRRGDSPAIGRRWRGLELLEPRLLLSWGVDDFSGTAVNPAIWDHTDEDTTGSFASAELNGVGQLELSVSTSRSGYDQGRAYVESVGTEPDQPWAFYTSVNFTATYPNRDDFDLGWHFNMSGGGDAYLEFDSRAGMTLKYGNQVVPHDGPALYPGQWYELMFAWDGTYLRAWYREQGRTEWLGDESGGLVLYVSDTEYPEFVRIGQTDVAPSSGSAVTMTLLVDDWQLDEPSPALPAVTEDQFDVTVLDTALWQVQDVDFHQRYASSNTGEVGLDGFGNLRIQVQKQNNSIPVAQAYAGTSALLPSGAWEVHTAASFSTSAANQTGVGLGYRFEMSDGDHAYLEFEGTDGMRIRYGTEQQPQTGASLHPSQWYELKFAWDGSQLQAWYRERGRSEWLGDGSGGLSLLTSDTAIPQRVKIGQTEILTSSGNSTTMTLLVDYWQQAQPAPATEGATQDSFDTTVLDRSLWQLQDVDFAQQYSATNTGRVEPDGAGRLRVEVAKNNNNVPLAQAYAETLVRLPDAAWESYTAACFTASRIDRSDVDLGYRFEMSDGSQAYLEFDSRDGMTLKHGSSPGGETVGPALVAGDWYELKFTWDAPQLRASYRAQGETPWEGDFLLVESPTSRPERVKIGQPDVAYGSGYYGVNMTLLVDSWHTDAVGDSTGPQVTEHSPAEDVVGPVDHLNLMFSETIDRGSFEPGDVAISGPGGTVAVTEIIPMGGRAYRVAFPPQSAPGAYHAQVGPAVLDAAGNPMAGSYDADFQLVASATAWAEDDFDGDTVDLLKWTEFDQDTTGSSASEGLDGQGQLELSVSTSRSGYDQGRAYIESLASMPDQPWVYYACANFSATYADRADFDLGWRFEMSGGGHARLEFDSRAGMTLKYGNQVVAYDGPALWATQDYELKFGWDGTQLRAWYRERGRPEWLGGESQAGLLLYASTSEHPESVKIGQTDVAPSSGSTLTMTLLVDYWRRTEPAPVAPAATEDQFGTSPLNPDLWQVQNVNFDQRYAQSNTGEAGLDGSGHLRLRLDKYNNNIPMAQTWVGTAALLPDGGWESYTAVAFSASLPNQSGMDLGYRFEMSDGSHAYLEFGGTGGMTVAYGNQQNALAGPALYPSPWNEDPVPLADHLLRWYELKFGWDETELRAWYREQGSSGWLGGENNEGLLLYASSWAEPQRVRIGQTDMAATGGHNVGMTLLVDYWQQAEPAPDPRAVTEDDFNATTLNPDLWRVQDVDFAQPYASSNTGELGPDGLGNLRIRVDKSNNNIPLAQTYVETASRLPDGAWVSYTAARFSATMANESDMGLGYRFEISDGGSAYLEFDGRDGMTVRYGSGQSSQSLQTGPSLYPSRWNDDPTPPDDHLLRWYELKFAWDGSQLQAWYRERGRSEWLGDETGGLLLYTSDTAVPDRVKIGQTHVASTGGYSVDMTLLVDYWRQTEPAPAAEGATWDDFDMTVLDTDSWRVQDVDFAQTYSSTNTGEVKPDAGYLSITAEKKNNNVPLAQAYAETALRLPAADWAADTAAIFTASRADRSDMDLGYRFEMSDGSYAYLEFDSVYGKRLKWGNGAAGDTGEVNLDAGHDEAVEYELRFTWNQAELRAFYRVQGETAWEDDFVLIESLASHPERVKIGQSDIAYGSGYYGVNMTLRVNYWHTQLEDTSGPWIVGHDPSGVVPGPLSDLEVTFNEQIDWTTFTPEDVTVTGPAGPVTVDDVLPDAGATTFRITFPTQTQAGQYTVRIGPDVRDPAGNLMDQDRDGTPGEDPDDLYTATLEILAVDSGRIGGIVWNDQNGNTIAEAGEPGIGGVDLTLYLDDGDSVFEAGNDDQAVATRQTAGDGTYDFTGLAAGDYWADVDDGSPPLSGFLLTTGNDPLLVNLAADQQYDYADFGYWPQQATLTVSTLADEDDGDYGPGDLSLREALDLAARILGDNVIQFDDALRGGTITLEEALGQLEIDSHLEIQGPGPDQLTVDAAGNSRVCFVPGGVTATISGLTITGGDDDMTQGDPGRGGGIYCDSGATLTLADATVTGNRVFSDNLDEVPIGGGIYNAGSMTITSSSISGNQAVIHVVVEHGGLGGGIYNSGTLTVSETAICDNSCGGGIYNSGLLSLTDAMVSGNVRGAGISNADGVLTIANTTIADTLAGRGISNAGELTLTATTISGNQAYDPGFGVVTYYPGGGIDNSGTLSGVNVTISGNSASDGAGIHSSGQMSLVNATITDNYSRPATEISEPGRGGGIHVSSGTATLHNTIVAGNFRQDEISTEADDVYGTFDAAGSYNLIGVIDGSTGLDGTGTLYGTAAVPLDPGLGPLADNGGPTYTHALLPDSPAIDAGSDARATDAGLTTDQRGFDRFLDGNDDGTPVVDVGAYESFGVGGILYAAAWGGTRLISIPTQPPYQPTAIGPMGVSMFDIAISPRGELFGVTSSTLYRVDATTGQAVRVGRTGHGGVNALDFAPDGTLYAATSGGTLLQLDPATGAGTSIGSLPGGHRSGGDLAFDPDSGRLLFTDASGNLGWVEPTDGSGEILGDTGYENVYGLDHYRDRLFAFGNSPSGTVLLSIDPASGVGTVIEAYSDIGSVYGIACWEQDPDNTPPAADGQSVSTPEDTPLSITPSGSDDDGDTLSFGVWRGPRHGTLSGADDQWTYTPEADFFGTDDFLFFASDGQVLSPRASVTIDVTPVNDAPVAEDSQINVWAGGSVVISLPAADIDDPITALDFVVADAPQLGSLGDVVGGQVTYTANDDASGTDTFTWYADDGHPTDHQSNTAVVSIHITLKPDLEPIEFTAPDLGVPPEPIEVEIGQRIRLDWTVTNHGPGTPGREAIVDAVYLSADEMPGGGDTRLGRASRRYVDELAPQDSYCGSIHVTIPHSGVLSGPQFLLLSVDDTNLQPEIEEANNTLAIPIEILPSIDLVGPFLGRFVDGITPVPFQWADLNDAYSGQVSIAIDTDDDPGNGQGHQLLVEGLPEDDDGADDRTEATLAGIAPGNYYVWAKMSDQAKRDTYSDPVPVQVFDLAAVSVAAEDGATAGNYRVLGVEAGVVDGRLHFRVRTNYSSAETGTDIYVNVGGDFREGTGETFGIPVINHRSEGSGRQLTAGNLYTGAEFLGGRVRHQFPVTIGNFDQEVWNVSTISYSYPDHGGWRTEIVGSVELAAIDAGPGTSVQIGWGSRCANGYDDVIIDIPGMDLAVTSVLYRPDEGIQEGVHESAEPGRTAAWQVTVANHGTVDVTQPWTLHWLLSTDPTLDENEDLVLATEVHTEVIHSGQEWVFGLSADVPDIPEPETGGFYFFGAKIIPPPLDGRSQNDSLIHEDPLWIQQVGPDADEENDGPSSATDLGALSSGSLGEDHTVDAMGDGDWYRFALPEAGLDTDRAIVRFECEQGDLDLHVYQAGDTDNPVLSSATRKQNTESVSLEGLAAGEYYLQVVGAYGDVSPAYVLESRALVGPWIIDSSPASVPSELSYVDVTFDEPILPNTFSPADVTLIGPDGNEVATQTPTHQEGTTFRIPFPTQTQAGIYSLTVGPWIEDEDGNDMDQNRDGVCGDGHLDRFQTYILLGVSSGIEIDLYRVSDDTGDPHSAAPGNEMRVFRPGENVRLTFYVTNHNLTAAGVKCGFEVRGPNNREWIYDSHDEGQDYECTLDADNSRYVSFDWVAPALDPAGLCDVRGSVLTESNVILDTTAPGPSTGFGPGDTLYDEFFLDPQHWACDHADNLIGLDQVFEHTRLRGYGQTIAVIDTGIDYTRAELGGYPGNDPERSFGRGYRVVGGDDFVTIFDQDPMDEDGTGHHGTNCAEVIASADPHAPGIAPASRLVAIRINQTGGWVSEPGTAGSRLAKALQWVIDHRLDDPDWPITVVNISQRVDTWLYRSTIQSKIDQLVTHGVTVVAAAGNWYENSLYLYYPASYENTISVGAVHSDPAGTSLIWPDTGAEDFGAMPDEMTCFSNRSADLDLVAPGCNLETPLGLFTGTSAAAPVVSGAAALVWEALSQSGTPNQSTILNALQDHAVTIWDVSDDPEAEQSGTPADSDHDSVLNTNLPFKRVNLASTIADLTDTEMPPKAYDQRLTTAANEPLILTLSASDPNGDALRYHTVDQPDPEHGTLTSDPGLHNDAQWTFTPAPGWAGTTSFTFFVSDGTANSNVATVTVEVQPRMTFSINVTYQVGNDVTRAAESVLVEVWRDHDGENMKIAQEYTAADGNVEITSDMEGRPIPYIESGIFFVVRAQNDAVVVHYDDGAILSNYVPYTFQTAPYGTTPALAWSEAIQITDDDLDDDAAARGFGIPMVMQGGRDFLVEHLGEDEVRPPVDVCFPSSDDPGDLAEYNISADRIDVPFYSFLRDDNVQDRVTLLHEYGHAVQRDFRGGNLPPGQGSHEHRVYDESSEGFALSEGWADFFGRAAHGDQTAMPTTYQDVVSGFETNNFWMGPDGNEVVIEGGRAVYVDQNGETGAKVQGAVASILWDVFDDPALDDDAIDAQVPERFWLIWNALTNDDGGPESVDRIDDLYLRWRYFADQGWEEYGNTLRALERIYVDHGIKQVGGHVFDDQYDTGGNNNDTFASPTLVTDFYQGRRSLFGLISTDEDWFRLDLPPEAVGQEVRLWIDFNHDQGNLDLQVIPEFGGDPLLAANSQPDGQSGFENEIIEFTPAAGQQYFVRVFGFGRNSVFGEDDFRQDYHPDFSPYYNLHVAVGNAAPTTADMTVTVAEDQVAEIALEVSDDGLLELVHCEITSLPEHGTLLDDEVALQPGVLSYLIGGAPGHFNVTYRPDPNYHGPDSFAFQANDGRAWGPPAQVLITVTPVNDPPLAADDQDDADEDHPLTIDVLANDEDVDQDTLEIAGADVFSASGALITVNPDGTVTYDPTTSPTLQELAEDQTTPDTFSYTVSDGHGGTDTATVTITVTGINDAPTVVIPIGDVTVEEDAAPMVIDVEDVFADVDVAANDDALTFTALSSEPGLVTVSMAGTELTLSYLADQNGTATVTVTATDLAGATASDTFEVTVTAVNDAPTVAIPIDDVGVEEDADPTLLDLDGVFADVDIATNDDALTLTALSSDTSLVTVSMAGMELTLSYLADQNGTATVTVTATDLAGATASDTFEVTVTAVNDAPTVVISIGDVTVEEDAAPMVIDVEDVFGDVDVATNDDALTFTALSSEPGLVTVSMAGMELTLSYLADQNGTATVTVTATDLAGATASDTFEVTVTAVNDAPTVANPIDDVTVEQDADPTLLDLDGVFADVDIATNDDILTLTALSSDTSLVTVSMAGMELTLSYLEGHSGTATVVVRATDTGGLFAEDTILVTVNPARYDFGDAPESYGTLLADDGARHRLVSGYYLGAGVDSEEDGQPNATATGDGSDEDGVVLGSQLARGSTVAITVTASANGMLEGWIDFNGDGDFDDAGEQVFVGQALAAGESQLALGVPIDAVAGNTFARFRFSSGGGLSYAGEAGDGEVEDYALEITDVSLEDKTLTVLGTDGDDHFEFAAGEVYRVTINGRQHEYPADQVDKVVFDGGLGNDTAVLRGTAGSETVTLHPTSAAFGGEGFHVDVTHTEDITVFGEGGYDEATLYDSQGNDNFVGTPTYAAVDGEGFYNRARSFEKTYTEAGGGIDVAKFYDSSGNDLYVGTPTYNAVFGEGFENVARYFEGAHVYATAGGVDVAKFYDSTWNDDYVTTPTYAALFNTEYHDQHMGAFYNRAKFFEGVHAYATAGGIDVARFYDSTWNDDYVATPTYAALFNTAYREQHTNGFYNRAKYFEGAHAYATAGGSDLARLYDSPGDDIFYGDPIQGALYNNTYREEYTHGFYNRAKFFEGVHAYASAAGRDVARLHGSDENDKFYGDSAQAALYRVGHFYNRAKLFEEVQGYAHQGEDDRAELHDSALDDLLEADDNWVRLTCLDLNSFHWVCDYDYVKAVATTGDNTKDTKPPLGFTLDPQGTWHEP